MTPGELFERAGRALFGDHYVAPLAHMLGLEKGHVRNMAADKTRVPPGVWRDLRRLLEARNSELANVLPLVPPPEAATFEGAEIPDKAGQ